LCTTLGFVFDFHYSFRLLLLRKEHLRFLTEGLARLDSDYTGLDASRAWIVYWFVTLSFNENWFQFPLGSSIRSMFSANLAPYPLTPSHGIVIWRELVRFSQGCQVNCLAEALPAPAGRFRFWCDISGDIFNLPRAALILGPGQVAHLAPTYASVAALCILGDDTAVSALAYHCAFNSDTPCWAWSLRCH